MGILPVADSIKTDFLRGFSRILLVLKKIFDTDLRLAVIYFPFHDYQNLYVLIVSVCI